MRSRWRMSTPIYARSNRSGGIDQGRGPAELIDRHDVQPLAGRERRLACKGAGIAALQQNSELESGEDAIPADGAQIAVAADTISPDDRVSRGESVPWLDVEQAAMSKIGRASWREIVGQNV